MAEDRVGSRRLPVLGLAAACLVFLVIGSLPLDASADVGSAAPSFRASGWIGTTLKPNAVMYPNQYLMSPDLRTVLILRSNGDLVLYSLGTERWSSGTLDQSAARLVMQADGNLVLYDASGNPLWSSGTWGSGLSTLDVRDDGTAAITRSSDGAATWSRGTVIAAGPTLRPAYTDNDVSRLAPGDRFGGVLSAGTYIRSVITDPRYALVMQNDGDLVLYGPGYERLWASNTAGSGATKAVLQADGDFVLYPPTGAGVWATNTFYGIGWLELQMDGNLVLYSNGARWSTGTSDNYFAPSYSLGLDRTVYGRPAVGYTLNVATPTDYSSGYPITWQWQRCTYGSPDYHCTDIPGAVGGSYTVSSADLGYYLRGAAKMTTTNTSLWANSYVTTVVVDSAVPVGVVRPEISGAAIVGRTLSVSAGNWSGATPMSFTYEWRRCDSSGWSCATPIGVGSTYVVQPADVGVRLYAIVTATNSSGSGSNTSTPSDVVQTSSPPANTARPAISGTAIVGQTLTAVTGVWTGTTPIVDAYEWRRCDAVASNCPTTIGTGATYVLQPADAGVRLRVIVTATNPVGTTQVVSTTSALVADSSLPANTSRPGISGSGLLGQTLTASNGTWTGGTPMSFSYEWRRCTDATAAVCTTAIGTGATYQPQNTDLGVRLRVVLTATNGAGLTTAVSTVSPVIAAAPTNTSRPTISGTATVGSTLSVSDGSWTGSSPTTFTYEWRRCDALASICSTAVGTGSSYVLQPADSGLRLRVIVTATNSAGSTQAVSTASNLVG